MIEGNKNGVNVKVIVRCRPPSSAEKADLAQFTVVQCRPDSKEVVVSQTIPGRKIESHSKTFTFDGVCNQHTTQLDLFRNYVTPIVEEVLLGFNCTIFAYGQTGTGKTYTMEGDIQKVCMERIYQGGRNSLSLSTDAKPDREMPLDECAGVIPRAVERIFQCLEDQSSEYSVKVSYLEIYNEELNDLLNDGERQHLRIFDDSNGKKSLSVDKLEEIPVNNPQDIYNILSIAVKKRHTAETLLNRMSSRSHCIFSITIHMKETNIDGEDVIKIGKLNLVDLAGAENIQRSGANTVKDRAKEAGMINQSLLTLGRVINALVERASYVPYRDSKLTRLLQDSLGGRTKTCIVATVSPSSLCLEETLSALDYAHRAKNIRNRPEVNQRMTKRVMIRELNQEIEKLKLELQTNRERNGVYLPLERYKEIESKLEVQLKTLTDLEFEVKRLRAEVAQSTEVLSAAAVNLERERAEHEESRKQLTDSDGHVEAAFESLNRLQRRVQLERLVSRRQEESGECLVAVCCEQQSQITTGAEAEKLLHQKLEHEREWRSELCQTCCKATRSMEARLEQLDSNATATYANYLVSHDALQEASGDILNAAQRLAEEVELQQTEGASNIATLAGSTADRATTHAALQISRVREAGIATSTALHEAGKSAASAASEVGTSSRHLVATHADLAAVVERASTNGHEGIAGATKAVEEGFLDAKRCLEGNKTKCREAFETEKKKLMAHMKEASDKRQQEASTMMSEFENLSAKLTSMLTVAAKSAQDRMAEQGAEEQKRLEALHKQLERLEGAASHAWNLSFASQDRSQTAAQSALDACSSTFREDRAALMRASEEAQAAASWLAETALAQLLGMREKLETGAATSTAATGVACTELELAAATDRERSTAAFAEY
eukprot:Polyplicarium_translucidae@DN3214_c0_g1_i4.p1